jgi:hypothetical protein
MRKNPLFLLALLILTACSSPAATQIFATETRSAATSPVPTPKPTEKPIPTPTEKPLSSQIIFNPEFIHSYGSDAPDITKKYSRVNLESIMNGTLLAQEKKYLQENNIFTYEVIARNKLILAPSPFSSSNGFSATVRNIDFSSIPKDKNPNTRPIKIFSYYLFDDSVFLLSMDLDKDSIMDFDEAASELKVTKNQLVEEFKYSPPFLIAAWAYYNPNKTVTIGHSFISRVNLEVDLKRVAENYPGRDYKFLPAYNPFVTKLDNRTDLNITNGWVVLADLLVRYPDLNPEPFINRWAKSGQMPKELETSLFTQQGYIGLWS